MNDDKNMLFLILIIYIFILPTSSLAFLIISPVNLMDATTLKRIPRVPKLSKLYQIVQLLSVK